MSLPFQHRRAGFRPRLAISFAAAAAIFVAASIRAEEEAPAKGVAREKSKAQEKGGKKEGRPIAPTSVPDSDNDTTGAALPPNLTDHFPIGRVFTGVAIPSYAGNRLKSVMRADSVVRVDEQYLDLVNLTVQVYDATGKPETTISMAEAAYDLVIGELASKTPSKIEQPRFTMTGEKMIYDTDGGVARIVGNVRVIVPDARGFTPDFGQKVEREKTAQALPAATRTSLPAAPEEPPARIETP